MHKICTKRQLTGSCPRGSQQQNKTSWRVGGKLWTHCTGRGGNRRKKKNQHTLETRRSTDRITEYIDSAYSRAGLTVFSCTRWLCRSWSWRGWCSPRLFLPVTKHSERHGALEKTKKTNRSSLPDSDTLHIPRSCHFFCSSLLSPSPFWVNGPSQSGWQH